MTASDFLSGIQHGDSANAAKAISVPLDQKFTDSGQNMKFEGETSNASSVQPSINNTGWSAT